MADQKNKVKKFPDALFAWTQSYKIIMNNRE